MTLTELLNAIGDDNLEFQVLDKVVDTLNWSDHTKRTTIKFQTEQGIDMKTPTLGQIQKFGMVVWIDRDLLQKVRESLDAKEQGSIQ